MLKYSDNGVGTLQSAVGIGDTTITIAGTDWQKFPTANGAGSEWFPITVIKADGSAFENMRVTQRASGVFTVVRAQGGTSPTAFDAGDIVSHRMTSEAYDEFAKSGDRDAFLYQGLNYFVNTGTANDLVINMSAYLEANDLADIYALSKGRVLIHVITTAANTGAMTLDIGDGSPKPILNGDSGAALVAGEVSQYKVLELRLSSGGGSWWLQNPKSLYTGDPIEFDLDKSLRNKGEGTHGSFDLTVAGGDTITTSLTSDYYVWNSGTRQLRLVQGFTYEFTEFRMSAVSILFDLPGSIPGKPTVIRCTGNFTLTGATTMTLPKNSQATDIGPCYGGRPNPDNDSDAPTARGSSLPSYATIYSDYRAVDNYMSQSGIFNGSMRRDFLRQGGSAWQLNGLKAISPYHDNLTPLATVTGEAGGSSTGLLVVADSITLAGAATIDASGDPGEAGSSDGAGTVDNDGGAGGNGGTIVLLYETSIDLDGGVIGDYVDIGGGLGGAHDADGLAGGDNAIPGPGGGNGTVWSAQIS